jgi:hypothetical protein
MLLNQGFLVVKWKSSLRKFDGRHNDLVNRYEISVPLVVSTSPTEKAGVKLDYPEG